MASSWNKAQLRWFFWGLGRAAPAGYRLPPAAAGAWALGGHDVGSACIGGVATSVLLS